LNLVCSDTLLQRLILKPAKLEQLAAGIRAIAHQQVCALGQLAVCEENV